MGKVRWLPLVVLGLALGPRAALADPVPSYVALPPGFTLGTAVYHRFDRLAFDVPPRREAGQPAQHVDARGRYWRVGITGTGRSIDIAAWSPVLERAGWQVLHATNRLMARRDTAAGAAWLLYTGVMRFELLETAPGGTLALPQPAETPETIAEGHDIPYLPPLPGATLGSFRVHTGPEEVTGPITGGPLVIGPPSYRLEYRLGAEVSAVEVQATYLEAFRTAGWTINYSHVGGMTCAHYARRGRDIWARVHGESGRALYLTVIDVGAIAAASRLRATLERDGHAALYGIYFDVDSDVVRPDSEATLHQILVLLRDSPALRLEIQGHTDDTGTPERNQRLSEARAANVRQWLVTHGVTAARLTSAGYAGRNPVADNRTPQGRALNRRVELARRAR